MSGWTVTPDDGLRALLLESGTVYLRWHLEHPVHAQLMSWRPVPGFTPSEPAYAIAVDFYRSGTELFAELKRKRLLRKGISADRALLVWTCLLDGRRPRPVACRSSTAATGRNVRGRNDRE